MCAPQHEAVGSRALATYPLTVHCYGLMSNHVHLMVTPSNATALPRVMQAIQNANLVLGFPETMGIDQVALFP